VLRRKRAIDTREMQQLVEECRLALKLRHPNVLLALGLVSDGKSNHGILTELMDLTLDELIEGQANPAGRRPSWESPYLSVAYDVARGMAYLHQHRIIHRDLKPGNVLLKLPMMTAKVADFGASKDFVGDPGSDPTNGGGGGSMSMTMSMAGTPVYMAPEVLRQDRYGKPADVWSFGGLLVHIATGQPPFFALLNRGGMSALNLMQAVTTGNLRPSSRVDELQPSWPPAVARLAEACFALAPEERPAFVDLAFELQEWLRPRRPDRRPRL